MGSAVDRLMFLGFRFYSSEPPEGFNFVGAISSEILRVFTYEELLLLLLRATDIFFY
jgi:hypothetical protein